MDAQGVMRLFAPDAVLMPHHGLSPVVGGEAIRVFLFAPGPPTIITLLDLELDEVSVRDDTGLVRGQPAGRVDNPEDRHGGALGERRDLPHRSAPRTRRRVADHPPHVGRPPNRRL